jgi:two-component system cell cycle sensor histidine kinase/response regulator CckA
MKDQTMEHIQEVPVSELSRSAFVRKLVIGVVLTNLFVLALIITSLRQSRLQYEKRASVAARNLSRMLEQNIGSSIDKIDLALIATAEQFERPNSEGATDRNELEKYLSVLSGHLPETVQLSVTDARGRIIIGANNAKGSPADIKDYAYFNELRDKTRSGLFISAPEADRFAGNWRIVVGRRINRADGSFAGVVYCALPVEHFRKVFSSVQLGPNGVVTLRSNDLGIIARFPEPAGIGSIISSKKAALEVRQLLIEGKMSGIFKTCSPVDNIERKYAFLRSSIYPYNIVVGLATADYLGEWRDEVAKMSAAAFFFFLFTILASLRTYRYWRRRNDAVRELILTRLCVDNAAIGIFIVLEDGTIRSVNDYACRLLGYPKDELLALNILDIDPVITDEKASEINRDLDSLGHATHESIHKRKDGTTFPVEITTNMVHFNGKEYPFSFVKDITERKKAEQALRITQFSVDHAAVPILWIREGSRIYYANEACGYLGYSPAELRGMTIYDIVPELSPEKLVVLYKELRERGSLTFEDVHKTRNGELVPVEITINRCTYEDVEFHVAYVRNISERKHAEVKIARSEQKFRAIFENAHDVIFLISKNFVFIDCNPAAVELFACPKEDIIGKTPMFYSPPIQPDGLDTHEKAAVIMKDVFDGRPQSFEWRHRLPGGIEFDVMVALSRFELEGEPILVAIVRDISRRKKMENALRLSTARFRELSDMLPEVIFECDLNGKLTYANKDAFPKYGYIEEDLVSGIYLTQLVVPEEHGRLHQAIEAKLAGNYSMPLGVQYTTITRNGTTIPAIIYSKPIYHEGSPVGLRGIVVDISERIRLEQQLYHAQKMEAVGQLAGGVAHDFNNILTAMIGFVHLILMKMDDDDPSRKHVRQISTLAERAAELTAGLLAFSRKQIMMPKPLDLNEIVTELRKMLKRLIRANIELNLETSPGMLVALADRGKMEQAIMNLVTNARDAIAAEGVITIKTSLSAMTRQFIHEQGFGEVGTYACIAISDTGCGMSEETRKKIFEPFFTTKEVGKGTGLGLSIVYGIVKQLNGYINVCSEEDKGTTFTIYLPLVGIPLENSCSTQGYPRNLFQGNETLLLAEDDATLNNLHSELLEEAGYTVITASDGEEAIEKFLEQNDSIDLLILDAVMPKFNGKQVLKSARTVQPWVNALFVSGYPADVLHEADILQEGVEIMMKPVTPGELLKKIREILDHQTRS